MLGTRHIGTAFFNQILLQSIDDPLTTNQFLKYTTYEPKPTYLWFFQFSGEKTGFLVFGNKCRPLLLRGVVLGIYVANLFEERCQC